MHPAPAVPRRPAPKAQEAKGRVLHPRQPNAPRRPGTASGCVPRPRDPSALGRVGTGGRGTLATPAAPVRAPPPRHGWPPDASRTLGTLSRPAGQAREASGCVPRPRDPYVPGCGGTGGCGTLPTPSAPFVPRLQGMGGCGTYYVPHPRPHPRALPARHGRPRDVSRGPVPGCRGTGGRGTLAMPAGSLHAPPPRHGRLRDVFRTLGTLTRPAGQAREASGCVPRPRDPSVLSQRDGGLKREGTAALHRRKKTVK